MAFVKLWTYNLIKQSEIFFYPLAAVCEDLVAPANGNVTLSTNDTVTTARFLCSTGYTLSGSDSVTCLSDGTWTDDVPMCGNCFFFLS